MFMLLNPLVLFTGVWGLVFFLFSLRVSDLLIRIPSEFYFPASLTLLAAVVGFALGYAGVRPARRASKSSVSLERISFGVRAGFRVILLVFAFEVVYSGGLPILYYLTGRGGVSYSEFGIPSLHGFLVATVLFVGTLSFWRLLVGRAGGATWAVFVACLLIPVITVHRGSLVYLLIQCGLTYVAVRVRGIDRRILALGVFIGSFLFAFSSLGNLRSGSAPFRAIAQVAPEYEKIPDALLWPYIYVTTPLNNFIYTTTRPVTPELGAESFSSMTPTFIRTPLWGPGKDITEYLVYPLLNVSSYASPLYLDAKWPGVIGFTFVLLFAAGISFRQFLQRGLLPDLMRLVLFDQVIILSVFANLLLQWVVMFQLVVCVLLARRLGASALRRYSIR